MPCCTAQEKAVFADAGYIGVEKREEIATQCRGRGVACGRQARQNQSAGRRPESKI